MWGMFDNTDYLDYQELLDKDMITFLSLAKQKKAVRIWTSNAPYELCGLYYTCYLDHSYQCPIYLVSLPEFIEVKQQELLYCKSWKTVPLNAHPALLSSQRVLTSMEIQEYANRCQALMQEYASLRANVNGTLISIRDDFYDSIIQRFIPDGPFPMDVLIGNVLLHALPDVSDSFLASRIQHMIETKFYMSIKIENLPIFGIICLLCLIPIYSVFVNFDSM